MTSPQDHPRLPRVTTSRRALLAGTGGAAVAAGLGTPPPASAAPDPARLKPFAMITDTHTNPEEPAPIDNLRRVFAHLVERDPAFVLHCGDITDSGLPEELDTYLELVPEELADRIHTIPGNHEEQWNADAMEEYRRRFGELRYSVDAAGYHLVGLDPMTSLEEVPLHFGRDQLAWLKKDLAKVPRDVPAICFLHFPLGGNWHFVDDSDAFLRTIAPYPVRAIFAGHTHQIKAERFNGLTQVIGGPIKNHATYVWADPRATDAGPVLEVTKIDITDEGVTTVPVATIPLWAEARLGPITAEAHAREQQALVTVRLPEDSAATSVQAQMFPQGGNIGDDWVSLARNGNRWSGTVGVAGLAPGRYRMMLRAAGADQTHHDTTRVRLGGGQAKVGWTEQLPDRIHGALAERDGLVVAGSISGGVHAVRASAERGRIAWKADVGQVYKRPLFTPDGRIIVGSADHQLYALHAERGAVDWRLDLGVPVLSDPEIATVDGEPRVFVTAGNTLSCVTLDGEPVWRTGLNGNCTGAAVCDGEQVYLGSTDGRGYALDARTGKINWAVSVVEGDTTYHKINYGPGAGHPRLLPDGAVLFPVFLDLRALDRATGSLRWMTDVSTRSAVYTPPLVTDHGVLWFDGRDGTMHLTDSGTGADRWTTRPLLRSRSAGPIPTSDPDVVWMVALGGTLIRINLADRIVQQVLQISPAFTYSTGVLLSRAGSELIVAAGQDGRMHAVVGLEAYADTE